MLKKPKQKVHRAEAPPPESGWATSATAAIDPQDSQAAAALTTIALPEALGIGGGSAKSRTATPALPVASSYDPPKPDKENVPAVAEALRAARCRRWVGVDLETTGFSDMDNHIIEIGAWAIDDGKDGPAPLSTLCKPDSDSFTANDNIDKKTGPSESQLLAKLVMHPAAQAKHGRTPEEILRFGQPITNALVCLIDFIVGPDPRLDGADACCLVFHNAPFDTRFLQTAVAVRKATLAQRFSRFPKPRFTQAVKVINTLARPLGIPDPDVFPVVCTQSLFRLLYPRQPYDLDSALRFTGNALCRESAMVHRADEDAHLTVSLFSTLAATAADVEAEHECTSEGPSTS